VPDALVGEETGVFWGDATGLTSDDNVSPMIPTIVSIFNTARLPLLRSPASLEGYGDHLFKGAVAAPYLKKQGTRTKEKRAHLG
jgi:hypothetical protein